MCTVNYFLDERSIFLERWCSQIQGIHCTWPRTSLAHVKLPCKITTYQQIINWMQRNHSFQMILWTSMYCVTGVSLGVSHIYGPIVQQLVTGVMFHDTNAPGTVVIEEKKINIECHKPHEMTCFTVIIWAILSSNILESHVNQVHVSCALNQKLAGSVGDPGIFTAGKSSFFCLQNTTEQLYRNERVSASNTVSSNETSLHRLHPKNLPYLQSTTRCWWPVIIPHSGI